MARLDSSAAAFALASISSACFFAVLSRAIFEMPVTTPDRSQIGEIVIDTGILLPSLRMRTVS